MHTGRLEAFSDGVLAIIITIMVLELNIPEHPTLASFWNTSAPDLLGYVLSFLFIGSWWNNHHHMLHITEKVTASIMWANLTLLFFLSLLPFSTRWMDESHFAPLPVASFGFFLFLAAFSFFWLKIAIVRMQGEGSIMAAATGRDLKGMASPILFACGMASAWVDVRISLAFYFFVASMWIIPDRRFERAKAAQAPQA